VGTRKRRRAVQIGIPALIIGVLTFVALWRLGTPASDEAVATTTDKPVPLPPVGTPAEVLLPTSIGRQASLENVRVLAVPSARTLWIGDDVVRVFAVLDPDVKQSAESPLPEGARVTLIGLVRRAPAPDVAVKQWFIDAETAETVRDGGIYLHVTEVQPVVGSQ
jgi:hypothetical protein